MNITWKKTGNALLLFLILIIIFTLLINILYYSNLLNGNMIRYFKIIIFFFFFFILGIYMGLNSPNKGYLYGLRLSLIVVTISIILAIIFNKLNVTKFIYYLIAISCITFGSMLGINKKHR